MENGVDADGQKSLVVLHHKIHAQMAKYLLAWHVMTNV